MKRTFALLSAFLLALGGACSDEPADSGTTGGGGDGGVGLPDTGTGEQGGLPDTRPDGTTSPDAGPDKDLWNPPEVPPEPGSFGASCDENIECDSGWCVEGPEGFICTQICSEQCPAGFDCKVVLGSGTDAVSLCIPRLRKLCIPCAEDLACSGGTCLTIDGEGMCTYACESDNQCLGGYVCVADETGAREGTFCQPVTGSCTCNKDITYGQRSCTRASDLGECFGFQVCDQQVGWGECTAPEPAPEDCNGFDDDCNGFIDDELPDGAACSNTVEGVGSCAGTDVCFGPQGWVCQGPQPEAEVCDYKDNNCDGATDEGFQEGGVYADFNHCGACNTSCGFGFPNAQVVSCTVTGGAAQCIVEVCEPGFVKANEFQCVPNVASICQPCSVDDNCLGDGSACVELTDGSYCGKACTGAAECPTGYSCEDVGAAALQCVPSSYSCSCDGSNTNLQRACSLTYTPPNPAQPAYTCNGFEQCTEVGWDVCQLPDEECDGVDNDCNGGTDEDFKDASGAYTSVEHCGGCNISCLALAYPHAIPSCDAAGPVPTCSFACEGGWFDVNGLADDGCECQPVAGPDFAGDSIDSNCDGIDGEVALGVFVAKDGADANPGTIDAPVLTIDMGLQRAFDTGKRDVYVATGVYSENVLLRKGIGLFGGYSSDFHQHDTVLFETAIIGQDPDASTPATVTAVNVGTANDPLPTVLDGFTLFGPNAANFAGENSYAIYAGSCGSQLLIRNNRIFGGAGGNGAAGPAGGDGLDGTGGSIGADAYDVGDYNPNGTRDCGGADHISGGGGGSLSCSDGTNVSGGNGGTGDCPNYDSTPSGISDGGNGQGPSGGAGGDGGWDGEIDATSNSFCGLCSVPPDNNPSSPGLGGGGSDGTWGASGNGCSAPAGSIASGHWVGGTGGGGAKGGHGGGGGGGGSGGGVEVIGSSCTDAFNGDAGGHDIGGSGGGGGSGGCSGTGGQGGQPGGGSFGIFIVYTSAPSSVPELTNNTIRRGTGGQGGAGGLGGAGGVGGPGSPGGGSGEGAYETFCARGGGKGGEGGQGGHGGGGGGGCGGASYGIYAHLSGANTNLVSGYSGANSFVSGGAGGTGGPGGASLGNSGSPGSNGGSSNTNF